MRRDESARSPSTPFIVQSASVTQAYRERGPSLVLLALLLPWLGAVASYTASRELILGIFLLIGVTIFAVAVRDSTSDGFLMLLLLCFSQSLLFSYAFLSNNLLGFD
ncbi:MAG TPA: hypothetical protein VJZ75_01525, partial [Candidatus Bathyarchaeia archaeon]|nr:hypothetical protein [Candidatus Bathyarchaeia archaeon]